jgi:hypothetical protein
MPKPDSYNNIKSYALKYQSKIVESGKGIVKSDPKEDVFAVLMKAEDVQRLVNDKRCKYLVAIMGVHLEGSKSTDMTISLLCAGEDKRILQAHRDGDLHGEEVWPDTIPLGSLGTLLE